MKILIVANINKGFFAPFVKEQGDALVVAGCEISYFGLSGHGLFGYLKNYSALKSAIKKSQPDIIHAHYGLSGLLANLQRRVPVVTTFHGSDINLVSVRILSILTILLSKANLFVSTSLLNKVPKLFRKSCLVLPCGVNLDDFPLIAKQEARRELGLDINKKYVLFAGGFDNAVKNPQLAQTAVASIENAELLEFKGYSRQQVPTLFSAVDVLLMTSHSEGSPQVIKEAMAAGCPIVSVNVGDVAYLIDGIEGCFLAEKNTSNVSSKLLSAIKFNHKTTGSLRLRTLHLDNASVSDRLIKEYQRILS